MKHESFSRKIFVITNYVFLSILGLICLLPVIHIIAISFSASYEVAAGSVYLWPVKFQTFSYSYVFSKPEISNSFLISVERVILGFVINMTLAVLIAYPLSKSVKKFKWRTFYAWYFFATMLITGGLVPTFMTVKYTGLMNSIWALVLPQSVNVFNVILLLNFFRGLPEEMEDAAFIDGAGHLRVLWSIVIPVSTPALATLSLITIVFHWNSWFDGIIFMNNTSKYPLQSYLQTILVQTTTFTDSTIEELKQKSLISDRTIKSAQIIIAALPIMMVYPFLQKYFTKGIILGSVKG